MRSWPAPWNPTERKVELQDVDLKAAVLTIRSAKFGKTRLVPLHASTCKVLADYISRRQRHWAGRPVSAYLFVSSWGNRLDGGDIHRTFYALSRQVGLRGPADRHGPRLHDLRHRFATKTLVNWYRAEQDPERKLPILSAYLGHVHVADTQWYFGPVSHAPRSRRLAGCSGSAHLVWPTRPRLCPGGRTDGSALIGDDWTQTRGPHPRSWRPPAGHR